MKYKVQCSGWVYVEADSVEEAVDKAQDGDTIYEEWDCPHDVEEVDDFVVEI